MNEQIVYEIVVWKRVQGRGQWETRLPEGNLPDDQPAGGQTQRADQQNNISYGMNYLCILTHRTRVYAHERFEINFN